MVQAFKIVRDARLRGCGPLLFMNQDPTSTLDRLLALAAEAEQTLAQTVASEEVRDAFAIVRGYLDLGRMYGEPVKVDDLERLLARIASSIGDAKFRRRFLLRLRTVAAWARLAPVEVETDLQGAACQA
jgi:hypothetical protein